MQHGYRHTRAVLFIISEVKSIVADTLRSCHVHRYTQMFTSHVYAWSFQRKQQQQAIVLTTIMSVLYEVKDVY